MLMKVLIVILFFFFFKLFKVLHIEVHISPFSPTIDFLPAPLTPCCMTSSHIVNSFWKLMLVSNNFILLKPITDL